MNRTLRGLASQILAAASRALPEHMADWSRAMAREMAEIPRDGAAVLFAAGCVRAIGTVAFAAWFRSLAVAAHSVLLSLVPSWSYVAMNRISANPRLLGLVCGAGAVGVGLVYMALAGAPLRYLLMNLTALVLAATLWLALGRKGDAPPAQAGLATLALAVPLLLTAFFGTAIDGASRWASVGPFHLQISLLVLPLMLILYARKPDAVGTIGMIVAALALAVEPDRAMAGVLMLGLLTLLLIGNGRLPLVAATASILAFVSTLLMPDTLAAVPFVDRILYTAFDVAPLAGVAVLLGAVALVIPAATALSSGGTQRPVLLVFGACWSGVLIAAALGNSPTPLVGYGGSAILGYFLSVALLPRSTRKSSSADEPASTAVAASSASHTPNLRVAAPGLTL